VVNLSHRIKRTARDMANAIGESRSREPFMRATMLAAQGETQRYIVAAAEMYRSSLGGRAAQ